MDVNIFAASMLDFPYFDSAIAKFALSVFNYVVKSPYLLKDAGIFYY